MAGDDPFSGLRSPQDDRLTPLVTPAPLARLWKGYIMPSMPASWRRYLRFWGSNVDGDIDDELRFHLESRVGEYINAGHSPEDARRIALDRFGDVPGIRGSLHRHDVRKLQQ